MGMEKASRIVPYNLKIKAHSMAKLDRFVKI